MGKRIAAMLGAALLLLGLSGLFLYRTVFGSPAGAYYARKGEKALQQGDWERGERLLRKALEKEPGRRESRTLLAGLYARQGRLEDCENLLLKGIRDSGRSSDCWLMLARLYVHQGRLEQAAGLLDQCRSGYLGLTVSRRRPQILLRPPGGSYEGALILHLDSTPGAVVYYAGGGAVPDRSSAIWQEDMVLAPGAHVLTLVAVKNGLPSRVLRAWYRVLPGGQ